LNRALKITGIVLLSLFVVLLFFSQTIYSFNTPTVTAALPANGKLDKKETATGLTDWSKARDIYVPQAGVVGAVFVKEGDTVEAGTHIAMMSFDTGTVTDQIAALEVSREKSMLSIETSQASIERLNQQISDLNGDKYTADDVSDYAVLQAQTKITSGQTALDEALSNAEAKQADADAASINLANDAGKKLEDARKQLADAQKQRDDTKALFDVGGVSQQDLETAQKAVDTAQRGVESAQTGVEDAQRSIEDAQRAAVTAQRSVETAQQNLRNYQLDLENQQNLAAKARETNDKNVTDQEKSRRRQIADWQYQVISAQKDIESKQLDIKNTDLQTESLHRQLKEYENAVYIDAPETGALLTLALQPDQTVNKGQTAATMAVGGTYTVTCRISLENNFVAVGDSCKLSNADHEFAAAVSKITLTDTGKEVEIYTDSPDISAGETFDVSFEKESAKSAVLVPNGAVNQDSDGYFVYTIKKRKGMMGDEYYAAKTPVYIGDSDDRNTILTSGMTFFEPIALLSDKPFSEGDTVRVKNEGDFFAS